MLVASSQAQMGNPNWNVAPYSIHNSGTGFNPPTAFTTNSYTWTQSGYTVTPGYGYDVNGYPNGTVLTDADGLTQLNGPNNMYPDENGQPLFSIMSGYIFNKGGFLVDTLIDTLTLAAYSGLPETPKARVVIQGYSDVCIVPNPANCQQYYVFTAMPVSAMTQNGGSYATPNNGPYYNINSPCLKNTIFRYYPGWVKPYFTCIDVSQQGPYMPTGQFGKNLKTGAVGNATAGDLFKLTGSQPAAGNTCGTTPYNMDIHYAATTIINKSGATPYRLVFLLTDQELVTYKVTGTGTYGVQWLNTTNIATISSNAGGYNPIFGNLTELEIYQDHVNNKIKVAFAAPISTGFSGANCLVFATYDTSGVYQSSTGSAYGSVATGNYINGVEFSPNGNYVFVSHSKIPSYTPIVERVTFSTPSTITSITTDSSFRYSQIEKGTDGNLYLISNTNTPPKISQIINSNSTTPTFSTNVLSLTSYSISSPDGYPWLPVFWLPDQIDQDVYGSNFNANASCCLFYTPFDQIKYYAGGTTTTWTTTATTQTWSANTGTTTATCKNPLALQTNTTSTVTIGEELRIPAGYTVTINNMTIEFSSQARLIVENGYNSKNGGNLVLNNCTLKVVNVCGLNDMWPGVQVWGSPASAHTNVYQGFLTLNNSQIQDSYNAVCVGFNSTWASTITPSPGAPTVNSSDGTLGTGFFPGGGGIIQAQSTTFLNNQFGIEMYSYTNSAYPNNNVITECAFLVNAALLASGITPGYHIFLEVNTEGFYVVGCSFKDTHYLYNDYGIFSSNSNFSVGDYYGSAPRSTFTNMLYGIYAIDGSGVGSTSTMSCTKSIFNNNYNGIYLGNVNNAIVETDTFRIYNVLHGAAKYYGLYMDNCTGYYVQDNYFTKYATGSRTVYGILINNSGPNINGIFRNSFYNLTYGSQAQYRNYYQPTLGQAKNATGLLYLCNTFSPNSITAADILVPQLGSVNNVGTVYTDTAGIGYLQGDGGSAALGDRPTADNQFSHTSTGLDFYIESGKSYPSGYVYYAPTGSCGVTSNAYMPVTTNSLNVSCIASATAPDCSSGGNGHRTMYVNPITKATTDAALYKQEFDSLNALVDGGSTNSLLNLINGNNNAQAVYNSLNSAAPYLSNAVLKTYLNSNYPANYISQILTACSPLSNEVNNAVVTSNLSTGIKNQINTIQTGKAKIDGLYNNMSSAFTARQFSLDAAIRILIRTSATDSINMAKALMKEKAMDLSPRVQVETGLSIGDSVMAASALTQVANTEGQSNYVKLSTILLKNMNKMPQQIMQDQSIVSQMQAFDADSTDRLTYLKANVLLQAIGKSNYVPYIQDVILPNANTQAAERTTQVEQIATPVVISLSTLYNSPNPFKESTTVKAVIVEKTQNAFIVITDMVGNEIARYPVQQGENNINVNAGGLNQAVMFCTLVVDGLKIKTNKMVLIK